MKNKKRRQTSFWKTLDKTVLTDIVKKSSSITDIFRLFQFSRSGAAFEVLKKRILDENIDISHFTFGSIDQAGKIRRKKVPLSEILVDNSEMASGQLKALLLKNGALENKCKSCDQLPEWNGKKLVLQLDHINGNSRDNRFENLRILCPNCHTQTPTFGRKNRGKKVEYKKQFCNICGEEKKRNKGKKCLKCFKNMGFIKKIETSPEQLQQLVDRLPILEVGRMFNVSDAAIRKRCKKLSVVIPKWPPGHWQKKAKHSYKYNYQEIFDYWTLVKNTLKTAKYFKCSPATVYVALKIIKTKNGVSNLD
jgi:hypothetical protein